MFTSHDAASHSFPIFEIISMVTTNKFHVLTSATDTPKSSYWAPSKTVRFFLESFYQFLTVDGDREDEGRAPINDDQRYQAIKVCLTLSRSSLEC